MRICPTCKKEKLWKEFAKMGSCRDCNRKICSFCGNIFCPTGKKTHCSTRCNLLGNILKTQNDCWEWQKGKVSGYGRIRNPETKKLTLAHRLSYEIFNGKFDQQLFVCHHCDNPSCINPDHLFLGDYQTNNEDCRKKKRQFPIKSVSHLRSNKVSHGGKLSPKEILEIRILKQNGIKTRDIASKYAISPEYVWQITTKKAWSHI